MIEFTSYKDTYYSLYRKLCDPLYIDGSQVSYDQLQEIEERGFLMGQAISREEALKAPFFEIALENGPVGLIRGDLLSSTFNEEHTFEWFLKATPEIKQAFDEIKILELGVIVVTEEMKGKGLAKKLLSHLESYARGIGRKHLFSWVPEKPENKPSKLFHLKNGFQIVALYSSNIAYGFKDYQCNLLHKKI